MNGTVYVVDDDESVRDSVRYLMESVGLCVRTFASSREFFHSEPMAGPSCLILDLRMPEVSGLETQEQLCQRGYESPVIIMTGHGDVPAAVRAMKLGALDFLEKPCNDQELLDKVQKAIDQDAIRIRQDREQDSMMANLLTLSLREKQGDGPDRGRKIEQGDRGRIECKPQNSRNAPCQSDAQAESQFTGRTGPALGPVEAGRVAGASILMADGGQECDSCLRAHRLVADSWSRGWVSRA